MRSPRRSDHVKAQTTPSAGEEAPLLVLVSACNLISVRRGTPGAPGRCRVRSLCRNAEASSSLTRPALLSMQEEPSSEVFRSGTSRGKHRLPRTSRLARDMYSTSGSRASVTTRQYPRSTCYMFLAVGISRNERSPHPENFRGGLLGCLTSHRSGSTRTRNDRGSTHFPTRTPASAPGLPGKDQ